MGAVLGGLLDQLGGDEAEHVLAATQEAAAGVVVDTGLGLVEALEGVLLAIDALAAGVRLEEGGVEEAQEGRQRARVLLIAEGIAIRILGGGWTPGGGKDDSDEDDDGCTDGEDLGVGVPGQDARGKRSHDTLALQEGESGGEGVVDTREGGGDLGD